MTRKTIGFEPAIPATPSLGVRRRRSAEYQAPGLQETLARARERRAELSYRAASRTSKYRSTPTDLGGTGDTHYRYGADLYYLREYAREADRNNALVGQIVDRALDQILGNGLQIDPQTGDPKVNETLSSLWCAWADDPTQCDYTGRFTVDEIERLALRHRFVCGDSFVLLDDQSGKIRLEEPDRVEASATGTVQIDGRDVDIVHGVEIDSATGRVLAYHFLRTLPINRRGFISLAVGSPELIRIPAEQVVHIFEPKRATQHRGITAFHAIFDRISLLSDIEEAEAVKLAVAACVSAWVVNNNGAFTLGSSTTETATDGTTSLDFQEFTPGMIVKLQPGETIQTFSPTVTTQDTTDQKRQLIREVGLALGLPLELTLLDHSDSSFSANRATLETYKRTARRQQRWIARTLRSRVYAWKVRQWVDAGLVPNLPTITQHCVHFPEWQYLDPQKEATADATRLDNHFASRRQIAAERGRDVDDLVSEIAEDNAELIRAAQKQAQALAADGIEGVTWREILAPEGSKPAPQAPVLVEQVSP